MNGVAAAVRSAAALLSRTQEQKIQPQQGDSRSLVELNLSW
jgi:hypothetical protein